MTYNQELSLLGEAGGGGHVIPLNLLNLDAIEPRKPESGIYCLFFSSLRGP
jgi:hypothetical protein